MQRKGVRIHSQRPLNSFTSFFILTGDLPIIRVVRICGEKLNSKEY